MKKGVQCLLGIILLLQMVLCYLYIVSTNNVNSPTSETVEYPSAPHIFPTCPPQPINRTSIIPQTPKTNDSLAITFANKFQETQSSAGEHLCILVAFRDSKDPRSNGFGRDKQLRDFKNSIQQAMRQRNRDYTLVVAEQEDGLLFNKGSCFNAGFLMANDRCNYFIFHDIDLVPLNPLNNYGYPNDGPLHLCSSSAFWQITKNIAGGALAMTNEQFVKVGGYSNAYWGWGYEDNDMFERIVLGGYEFRRLPPAIGKYEVKDHPRASKQDANCDTATEQEIVSQGYSLLTKAGRVNVMEDGVISLNATLLRVIADEPDYLHFIFRPNDRTNLLDSSIFRPSD